MKKRMIASLLSLMLAAAAVPAMRLQVAADEADKIFEWPVKDCVGITSCFTDQRAHNAIDISANPGAKVTAVADGVVCVLNNTCQGNHINGECSCSDGYGKNLWLKHEIGGVTYYTHYSHLSEIDVKLNAQVKAGDLIGKVGNTGKSYGGHLDFQVGVGSRTAYADPGIFLKVPAGLTHTGTSPECCDAYVEGLYRTGYTKNSFNTDGVSLPDDTHTEGKTWSLRGMISAKSGRIITRVKVETTDRATGEKLPYATETRYPNSLSYNMLLIDAVIYFDRIPVGNYTYRIIVRDEVGYEDVVAEKNFTVVGTATETEAPEREETTPVETKPPAETLPPETSAPVTEAPVTEAVTDKATEAVTSEVTAGNTESVTDAAADEVTDGGTVGVTDDETKPAAAKTNVLPFVIAGIAAAVIVGGVVGFVMMRKKKQAE